MRSMPTGGKKAGGCAGSARLAVDRHAGTDGQGGTGQYRPGRHPPLSEAGSVVGRDVKALGDAGKHQGEFLFEAGEMVFPQRVVVIQGAFQQKGDVLQADGADRSGQPLGAVRQPFGGGQVAAVDGRAQRLRFVVEAGVKIAQDLFTRGSACSSGVAACGLVDTREVR